MEECGGKVEQCRWNSVVEQFWWNSGTVMLEQCRCNNVGGTLRWNSGTVFVEQCGGTVEQCWRNSGTVIVEQCGGKWNSETVMVEPWNSDSGTVWWKSFGGTVGQ